LRENRWGAPSCMVVRCYVSVVAAGAMLALAGCSATDWPSSISDVAEPPTGDSQTTATVEDTGVPGPSLAHASGAPGNARLAPHILPGGRHLQCVPYARSESGVDIYGHAANWWRSALGRYRRSNHPAAGAVIVFRSTQRNPHGHLAVVRMVLNDRKIIVDHANWLNDGHIHRGTPVLDISPSNDWSLVRVWYTPGKRLGAHAYPVTGFIHPEKVEPGETYRTTAVVNVRQNPSRTARRVARLPKSAAVELLGRAPGRPWLRIGQNGRALGYIFADLIVPEN